MKGKKQYPVFLKFDLQLGQLNVLLLVGSIEESLEKVCLRT